MFFFKREIPYRNGARRRRIVDHVVAPPENDSPNKHVPAYSARGRVYLRSKAPIAFRRLFYG